MRFPMVVALCSAAAFVGAGGYSALPDFGASSIADPASKKPIVIKGGTVVERGASCNIKGNVSIGSGERIYHVPGQQYYEATKISPQYGERWFCSEEEARAAGWRKAGY